MTDKEYVLSKEKEAVYEYLDYIIYQPYHFIFTHSDLFMDRKCIGKGESEEEAWSDAVLSIIRKAYYLLPRNRDASDRVCYRRSGNESIYKALRD